MASFFPFLVQLDTERETGLTGRREQGHAEGQGQDFGEASVAVRSAGAATADAQEACRGDRQRCACAGRFLEFLCGQHVCACALVAVLTV